MNNEYSYSITIPQNAILLTQIYACVLTLVISQNIKYRRFTPKAFNFLFAILYSIMLFMTVYLQVLLQTVPAEWILNVFSLFFIAVYFVDILSIFIDRKLILGILSLTFSVFIMLMDVILLPNTWFANNIVASLVSAAIVKFIVIKKLKGAMLPLTVLWIFFIIRQIGMVIHIQDF